MKTFRKADLSDIELFQKSSMNNCFISNNYGSVNSFLYRNKLQAKILVEDGWILERFKIDGLWRWSFPHNVNGNYDFVKNIIESLIFENESENCLFYDVTEKEKDLLLSFFPNAKVQNARDLSDYIYLTENLRNLGGSKLSPKRNHLHRFQKKYPDVRFEALTKDNLYKVKLIENTWLMEMKENLADEKSVSDLDEESSMITEALENFEYCYTKTNLSGGIASAGEIPFAFYISSLLSSDVTDIHFEKCLYSFAKDGGYAFINHEEAKNISSKYINREEDLGIEGLRKAKLSYYPEIIVPKFNVTVFGNVR